MVICLKMLHHTGVFLDVLQYCVMTWLEMAFSVNRSCQFMSKSFCICLSYIKSICDCLLLLLSHHCVSSDNGYFGLLVMIGIAFGYSHKNVVFKKFNSCIITTDSFMNDWSIKCFFTVVIKYPLIWLLYCRPTSFEQKIISSIYMLCF